MADVQFDIKTVGIPKVKSDLTSVFDQQKKYSLAVEQMHEKSALRIKQIEQKLANDIANIQSKGGKNRFDILAKEVAAEEKAAAQIKKIHENGSLARKQIQDREAQSTLLNYRSLGLAAQAAGLNKIGYGLRTIGSITDAGVGIGGFAAVAGVGLAAKAVMTSFNEVADIAKQLTSSFISAVAEIGGARNIQQIIVDSAKNEQLTNLARLTVNSDQRVSKSDLNSWAANLSKNPALGGQSKDEWLKAAGLFGTETGLQRDLISNSGLTNILGMMGHMGGVNPSQILGSYAGIYNQNRSLSQKQILDIMSSGIGIGREGQFNIQDLVTGGGRLLSVPGSRLGGDYIGNIKSVLSYGALVKGKTPGRSLEEAGTEVDAFFRELAAPAHVGAAKQLGVKFDKNGNITNADQAIAKVVANKQLAEQLIPGLATRESGMFIGHMSTGIPGITDKSTNKEVEAALLAQIHHYENLSISQEQLTKENEDAIGVTDKFKAAFNELSNAFEGPALQLLKDTTVSLKGLVDSLLTNKDQLSEVFSEVIIASSQLYIALAALSIAASKFASVIIKPAIGLAIIPYKNDLYQNKFNLTSDRSKAANLAGEIESGKTTDLFGNKTTLTPSEIKDKLKQYNETLESIDKEKDNIATDQAMIKALVGIPDSLDKAADLFGSLLGKVQTALDKNTEALEKRKKDLNGPNHNHGADSDW